MLCPVVQVFHASLQGASKAAEVSEKLRRILVREKEMLLSLKHVDSRGMMLTG